MRDEIDAADLVYQANKTGGFGSFVDLIEQSIRNGDMVVYKSSRHLMIHSAVDIQDAITIISDEDRIAHYVSVGINRPASHKFCQALDEAIATLSEEIASHYKGKFDE
jgi:hypothetical protein